MSFSQLPSFYCSCPRNESITLRDDIAREVQVERRSTPLLTDASHDSPSTFLVPRLLRKFPRENAPLGGEYGGRIGAVEDEPISVAWY